MRAMYSVTIDMLLIESSHRWNIETNLGVAVAPRLLAPEATSIFACVLFIFDSDF